MVETVHDDAQIEPAVAAELRSVYDPCCREDDVSIVDMGMLHHARMDDGVAHIELTLTSGWCPHMSTLLADIEGAACRIDGVNSANVRFTWDDGLIPEGISRRVRRKLQFLHAPKTGLTKTVFGDTAFVTR